MPSQEIPAITAIRASAATRRVANRVSLILGYCDAKIPTLFHKIPTQAKDFEPRTVTKTSLLLIALRY